MTTPIDLSDPAQERDRAELLELLRTLSFEEREVVLASGKRSNFYIDSKQVTLHPRGLVLVGRLLLAEIVRYEEGKGVKLGAVGGPTLGADPIAAAVSLTSSLAERPLPAYIVRKEPKGHGTQAFLEGARNIPAGSEVALLEDVVTTGASASRAITRVREAGFEVGLVLGLVDRLEGGREHLQGEGVALVSLFDCRDFLKEA